ncbi:MAG: 2OG-Fe(II) oxygenase [Alphaproteobacteria bacterium]
MGLVDTERYPIHDLTSPAGQALVAQCRRDLAEHALCSLPGFLRPEAIRQMLDEAQPLMPDAVYTDTRRNLFFQPAGDDSLPPDHPRNVIFPNRFARIINHCFPNEGPSRTLFLWPALTEFVRQVFGAETMYPSQCPHLAMTMKIEGEGDTDGWHYDGNDGVISLLLQKPDEGGEFEYAPYIRTLEDERLDDVAKVLHDPDRHAKRPPLEPGTFVFFNGNLSLHRVAPVGKTVKPRMILLYSFDRSPNFVFPDRAAENLRSLPRLRDLTRERERFIA